MKEGGLTMLTTNVSVTATSRLEILQVYKLLQCVRQEDKNQITKLCTQGIPMLINHRDPEHGESALHLAAQSNKDSMTKFLLNLGAHPNGQDFQGRTPVMIAADYGHDKTMEILAEAGADMTIKDKEGRDVLFYCLSAPTSRHRLCLEIALAYGADVNNTFENSVPTLVSACEAAVEKEKMCLMLLEKGANPNATNKINGRCALSFACFSGSAAVVRALLKNGASPNNPSKHMNFPVHFAAQRGVLDSVKSLAAYGGDMTVSDKLSNNALHHAAEGGFGMVCKFLAQRGCNPKQKNIDGFTPRLLAKEKSFKEASKELRKAEKSFTKFSKPGMKNPNEPEILYLYDWVCERSEHLREVLMNMIIALDEESTLKGNIVTRQDFDELMEEMKAPITQNMKKRLYELHDKERKEVIDIDEFLSGKKYISKAYLMSAFEGKKKKKGKKGKGKKGKKGKLKIPMPICTEKDGPRRPDGGPPHQYIEKQVLWTDRRRFNRDKPPKHPLEDDSAWYLQQPDKQFINIIDVVRANDMETLQYAFDSGVEVDTRDKYFKTPLMASCAEGNIALTNYLLSLGAKVDARDNFKWTPLHHACHSGQLDVVKALLYAGAEGNAVTWNGATPLMRAIESGKTDVVKFLLNCDVNMIMINKKEKTALDVARDWGGAEIYQMVKEKYDAAPKPKKDKNGKIKIPPIRPLNLPPLYTENEGAPSDPANQNPEKEGTNTPRQGSPRHPRLFTPPSLSSEIKHQKSSVTSQALELFGKTPDTSENVVFTPRKAWVEQQTTNDLLDAKQMRRERFGDEVDFDSYQKPLKQNINLKIQEFEKAQS